MAGSQIETPRTEREPVSQDPLDRRMTLINESTPTGSRRANKASEAVAPMTTVLCQNA